MRTRQGQERLLILTKRDKKTFRNDSKQTRNVFASVRLVKSIVGCLVNASRRTSKLLDEREVYVRAAKKLKKRKAWCRDVNSWPDEE
jgi:hypothetical protein